MHAIRRTAEVAFVTLSHIRSPILKRDGGRLDSLSLITEHALLKPDRPVRLCPCLQCPLLSAQSLLATRQNVLSALFRAVFRTNSGSVRIPLRNLDRHRWPLATGQSASLGSSGVPSIKAYRHFDPVFERNVTWALRYLSFNANI